VGRAFVTRFAAVLEAAQLEPIDRCFGDLLRRRARAAGESLQAAELLAISGALLSRQRGHGHSCLHLAAWAERPFPGEAKAPFPTLPGLSAWSRDLSPSSLVGDGKHPTPMVLDDAGRLYLYRYWQAEQRLAQSLEQRLEQSLGAGGDHPFKSELLAASFRRLFPPPADGAPDWQAVAAAAALVNSVLLVSGGPGTGKTTTISRILALELEARPDLHIALAAPTGKAAARLGESIAEQLAELEISEELRQRLPQRASTLHRLLGYQGSRERFHYRENHPLTCDLLVIDEASMVDLLMMDAVLSALPPTSRLILLGDRDQLASVDTGFVFGDLCTAAHLNGFTSGFGKFYKQLSGQVLPSDSLPSASSCLGRLDLAVELRKNYRFQHQPGIGQFAAAIRQQDTEGALRVLHDPAFPDVRRRPLETKNSALLELLDAYLESCLAANDAEEAFALLSRFRVLCPTRRGRHGVEGINLLVEEEIARRLDARPQPTSSADDLADPRLDPWYRGRPVLITTNDYQVGLFNGDLGVCWPAEGRRRVWFPTPEGTLKALPPARLPEHETAWAMTVHKSQGSELEEVVLVLPEKDSPLLSRELLYTAVTRARKQVWVVGASESLAAAIERRNRRRSGLAEALAPPGAVLGAGPPVAEESGVSGDESDEARSDEKTEEPGAGQLSLF